MVVDHGPALRYHCYNVCHVQADIRLDQCWVNAGPPFYMVGHHKASTVSTSCFCLGAVTGEAERESLSRCRDNCPLSPTADIYTAALYSFMQYTT